MRPGVLLLHADARRIPLRDESVPLVIADPPFNVGKKYGPHYNDRRPAEEYWAWLAECLGEIARVMRPASTLYVFHTDMGAYRLKPLGEKAGLSHRQTLVWYSPNGYRGFTSARNGWSYSHEPILRFDKGRGCPEMRKPPWFQSVIHAPRRQTNWNVEPRIHVAQKPELLIKMLIAFHEADLVLDPFSGSGTTLVAAQTLRRSAVVMDIGWEDVLMAKRRAAQAMIL